MKTMVVLDEELIRTLLDAVEEENAELRHQVGGRLDEARRQLRLSLEILERAKKETT